MVWITKEGLERLGQKLSALEDKRRSLLAQLGEEAERDFDLPENPIWKQLQVELRFVLPKQIAEIKEALFAAEIIESSTAYLEEHSEVRIGSRVDVLFDDGNRETILLVGPHDIGLTEESVSYLSPLGEAVLSAKPGESRAFSAPGGERKCTVLSIEKGLS